MKTEWSSWDLEVSLHMYTKNRIKRRLRFPTNIIVF